SIGLFIADKRVRDRDTGEFTARNDVVAGDAFFTFRDVYNVIAQVGGSYDTQSGSGNKPFSGLFYNLTARRRDKNLFLEMRSEYYSEGFRAETSPITRVNVLPSSATASYRFYTGIRAMPYFEPGLKLSSVHE